MKQLLSTPEENGPTSPMSAKADASAEPPRHVKIATLRSQIKELQSKEARKQTQVTRIREAVDKMKDAPAPLFDPLGEGVDVKELDTALTMSMTGSATTKRHGRGISIGTLKHGVGKRMDKMKGMFRNRKAGRRSRSESMSSAMSASDIPRSSSEDMLGDGVDEDSDTSSTYDEPPEIPVEDEEWFFGDIDRKLAESKCKVNGDYLVRYSARQNKYVLTCCLNNQGKHFVIQQITEVSLSPSYNIAMHPPIPITVLGVMERHYCMSHPN